MKLSLVSYWKECWKLSSFQLAVIVLLLEWGNNLFMGLPETPQAWVQSIVVLVLPLARIMQQTTVTTKRG